MLKVCSLFGEKHKDLGMCTQGKGFYRMKVKTLTKSRYKNIINDNKYIKNNTSDYTLHISECSSQLEESKYDNFRTKYDKKFIVRHHINDENGRQKQSKVQNQNNRASISGKNFKFIEFREVNLEGAIMKNFLKITLNSKQFLLINQTIKLPYVEVKNERLISKNRFSNFNEEIIIDLKEIQFLSIKIQEICDACFDTQRSFVGSSWKLSKKFIRRVASFIQNLRKNRTPIEMLKQQKNKQEILRKYVQKYMPSNKVLNNIEQNNSHEEFYKNIYEKYERIPFNQRASQNNENEFLNEMQLHRTSSKIGFRMRQEQKLKCTSRTVQKVELFKRNGEESSHLKMKFYNNLRKEVMKLNEDTLDIISGTVHKNKI